MLDSQAIIDTLRSPLVQSKIEQGVVRLLPPATDDEIKRSKELLGPAITEAVLPLVRLASGLETPHDDPSDPQSFCLRFLPSSDKTIWNSVYPRAVEMWVCDELMYWDVPDGHMYFVWHEGPTHSLVGKSMESLLEHLVARETPLEAVCALSQSGVETVETVNAFRPDSPELASFLSQFPAHYEVHDLRSAGLGAHFVYHADLDGFWRFGDRPLWVQRCSKGLKERLREWWRGRS